MIAWLETRLIRAADWINQFADPFDDFTRPAAPKYPEALNVKAQRYKERIQASFLIRGGTVFNYRIPTDPHAPLDLGDQSLWHGIWTGAVAIEAAMNPSVRPQLDAFIKGLEDQQPAGFLARGLDESGNYRWDTSNDQATGHLFGLYFAWRYGNGPQKSRLETLIDMWANGILSFNHALVNPDFRPTKYGQLAGRMLVDPLRLSLCVAIYAAAGVMTGIKNYKRAAADLWNKYEDLLMYPKVRFLGIDTLYDTHRAAIHLAILNRVMPTWQVGAGVQRLRHLVRKDGNIWVNALCAYAERETEDDRALALKVLSEFALEDSQMDEERINSADIPQPWRTISHGEWCSRQPIPRWKRSADDFCWQRNLHGLDKRGPAQSHYSGLDYYAAYILSRFNTTVRSDA